MLKKNLLRKQIISIRNNLTDDFINLNSNLIVNKILLSNEFLSSKVIFLYLNAFKEVSLDRLISKCWDAKKSVCVPLVDKTTKTMTARIINSWDDLLIGAYGIREPQNASEANPASIDLILIPAVAYDYSGFRLGMGAGFYDKYVQNLSAKTIKVGICWDLQLVQDTFPEAHDLSVDTIITEQKTIRCQKGKMY